jgi:hypothetical protein
MDHPHITLNFLTNQPRNAAIRELERLCQANGVFILDFHMFSNVSLALNIEANAAAIPHLGRALAESSFQIDGAGQAQVESLAHLPSGSMARGTLQVTFAKEDGELRITTPMVPG